MAETSPRNVVSRPVMLSVAPNGGRRSKADHPDLPLTAAEIARTAEQCLEAGAAMIHIHIRDREGRHLLDADAYQDVLRSIRNVVGDNLVLQITTEAVGLYTPKQQMDVVMSVRPPTVSIALRELMPSTAHTGEFAKFMEWLIREEIAPQVILYDPAEASALNDLQRRGIVPGNIPVLYVLGRYAGGQPSSPSDLLPFLASDRPRFDDWSLCAFGAQEIACVCTGALLGGGMRVGFENNLLLPDGAIARSNSVLVAAAALAVRSLGLALIDGAGLAQRWGVTRR